MTDIYEAKGYGEITIGFGAKLGILVVDFQRGFVDPSFQLGGGPMMEAAISRTAELVKVARQHDVPVANCYVAYPSAKAAPYWKITGVAQDFRRDSQEVSLDPRIVDYDYDYVFEKSGASAFFQTPLAGYFVKHGVDTVAITGCVTSGCIRASAVDSFQYGFRTMLVEDCSSDNDMQPHLDTLRDVGRRYADIVKAEDLSRYIQSGATVSWGALTGAPGGLIRALDESLPVIGDCQVFIGLTVDEGIRDEHLSHVQFKCIGGGGTNSRYIRNGSADIIPIHLGDVPKVIRDGVISHMRKMAASR